MWIYPTFTSGGNQICLLTMGSSGQFFLQYNNSNFTIGVSNLAVTSTFNYVIQPYVWTHLAVTRSGTTTYGFINGNLINTATDSTSFAQNGFYVGSLAGSSLYFTGYISNVRFVNGNALYTSNFTPSSTPLSVVANTSLLTSANNTFIGSNTTVSNVAITVSGTPQVQPFSPFNPTTAYSNTVVGGSVYFNGTTDSLTANGSNLNFISGQFTIEAWVYYSAVGSAGAGMIISQDDGNNGSQNFQFGITTSSNNLRFLWWTNSARSSATSLISSGAVPTNSWNHVAVTWDGTTLRLFINGVLGGSTTSFSPFNSASTLTSIGNNTTIVSTAGVTGYISNARIIKGSALYTSAFTPSTAPLTPVANTSLLLNATNAKIIDSSQKSELITYGTAAISTAQSKFGGTSMYFDGSTGAVRVLSSPLNQLGTGDFTIEFWTYLNSTTGSTNFFDMRSSASSEIVPVIYQSGGTLYYYVNGSNAITGSTLGTGTWYHIAVSRASGSTKMFVNGSQVGSTYTDNNSYIQEIVALGYYPAGNSGYLSGYIDEVRVTKGYARYTSNFTPPTTAFLNT
jgi:Concanavalin A-like lectin/glucanases superfamily